MNRFCVYFGFIFLALELATFGDLETRPARVQILVPALLAACHLALGGWDVGYWSPLLLTLVSCLEEGVVMPQRDVS